MQLPIPGAAVEELTKLNGANSRLVHWGLPPPQIASTPRISLPRLALWLQGSRPLSFIFIPGPWQEPHPTLALYSWGAPLHVGVTAQTIPPPRNSSGTREIEGPKTYYPARLF